MYVFPSISKSKSAFFSLSGGSQTPIRESTIQPNVDATTTPIPAVSVSKKQRSPKKHDQKKSKLNSIFKKRQRGGVRSKKKRLKSIHQSNKNSLQFSIVGCNSAGLKAKIDSLNHMVKTLNYPSCITIQESKLPKKGMINMKGYEIFEKTRNVHGGGLLTAIDSNLNPFEVEVSDKTPEILVVQCSINDKKIRVINGYGPQEDDCEADRFRFWQVLDQEISAGKRENCMIVIQLDANAKLGKNIIDKDPHDISENGRLLLSLIERESLSLLNA